MSHAFTRRSMLGTLCATGALALVHQHAAAASRRRFFERTNLPIGLQVYTLGDEAGKDIDATFAQIAAIGYRSIELPGLYGRTPAEIGAAAKRAGISIASLHLPLMEPGKGLTLLSTPQAIADGLGALGASDVVAPIMQFPANMTPRAGESFATAIARAVGAAGEDLWKNTAALLNEKAAALKNSGVRVGYHNHNVEFIPLGKTNGWEVLLRECDPALIGFQIDVGWIKTAGRDPARFLSKLKGRVMSLHVKDVAADNVPNFALTMKPAEVGSGIQDWARILPAAYKAGVRKFFVEQEAPFTMPRIEAARKSHGYLAGLRA